MDWNRAPNNYDKIALVIRQIRASQDRVQRLRMIVPVWRCDAEAPVALLPPAPLRPLSVTSLTSRWTTGPTGAGAAPCTNPTSFPLSFSSWGGEARARGLAARRFLPTHHTLPKHTNYTHWTQWALDVAYSATASLAVRRNDSAAPARWATPFRQRIPGGSVRPTTSVENALATGVGRSTWGDPLAPSSPNLPSCSKPAIVLQ